MAPERNGHGNGAAHGNGHGNGHYARLHDDAPAAVGAAKALPAPAPLPAPSHFGRFRADIAAWREWLPLIAPHTICLMLNMYTVSFMTAIQYYILNDDEGIVPLLGPHTSAAYHVPHDAFFAVYNSLIYVGDSASRQMVYRAATLRHPAWYLLASALGGALCLAKLPLVAPLGISLVFFANGAIYATSTKHIDTSVGRVFNLTALSIWLFIGDVGSVVGSNTWQVVAPLVCAGVDAPHMCVPERR